METEVIVVGVDGSPHTDTAVRWAAARARRTGACLRLVHAHAAPVPAPAMPLGGTTAFGPGPDAETDRAGAAVLSAAADLAVSHAPGVDVTTDLRSGSAATILIDVSAEADLVVVGSRGRGGFAGLLHGSVSARVSGRTRCPTVVVRDRAPETGPIVVGVDGSQPGAAALSFAFAEADRRGAGVIAVHAWTMPLPVGPGEAAALARAGDQDRLRHRQAASEVLADALAGARREHPDVPVHERLTEAGPAGALIEAAAEPAMIVVGSRGHGQLAGLLLGSTSRTVLHNATCPVVVVHAAS
jgi:nucleotide-binding universal stress UspA family protein